MQTQEVFFDCTYLDNSIPYVFRHTMCTNLIKAGTPVATVQRIIGDNTVDVIMKVYTHINSSDIADAMEDVYNAYTSLLSK